MKLSIQSTSIIGRVGLTSRELGVGLTLVLHSVHGMGASMVPELVVDLGVFGVGPTLMCITWAHSGLK